MIILGFDPGTAILGWGVIDTGPDHRLETARCLAYDCVVTDKGLSDATRLVAIAAGVEAVLKQYQPDLVSVEKLFFSKNQTTAMTVSQARGVVLMLTAKQGCPIAEYNPMQVKQSLTGYGKADKKQVQQMVKLILHLLEVPQPDDAADALAIALTAAQTWRLSPEGGLNIK